MSPVNDWHAVWQRAMTHDHAADNRAALESYERVTKGQAMQEVRAGIEVWALGASATEIATKILDLRERAETADVRRENTASEMAHVQDALSAARGRIKVLEVALRGIMADIGGGTKVCGHDFACVCAGDAARAALSGATYNTESEGA